MQQFIEKYGDRIVGVLSGFDRLVLRGSPRRLDISYWDPARQVMVAREWKNSCSRLEFFSNITATT